MASASNFPGSSLHLLSIEQLGPSYLKLKYTQDPQLMSNVGANDGLNPSNYTITGPQPISVETISVVAGDPQSVFLYLSNPLIKGNWRISVANVTTIASSPLVAPTFLDFEANELNYLPSIGQGAQNQHPSITLKRHVTPAIKGPVSRAFWDALSVVDVYLLDLARKAFNQMFITSSSDKYLDINASNLGIIRPADVGISEENFKKLIIEITAEKLTLQSFLKVLEIFYGKDVLRANATSDSFEPFDIQNGADFKLNIDNKEITIFFNNNDFAQPGQGTAIEVASVITRFIHSNKLDGFAEPFLDEDGNVHIRIYSGALGLKGRVFVTGGLAQNELKFPTQINTTQATGTTFNIDNSISMPALNADIVRFTFSSGTNPTLQLVNVGDYVNIFGANFNSNNRGTFTIVNVTPTYFEIKHLTGVNQSGVALINATDLQFYRPTVFTVHNNERISLASQGIGGETDIVYSTTSQIVNRSAYNAAYLSLNNEILFKDRLSTSSVTRTLGNTVTVTTIGNHGLSIGDIVWLAPGDPKTGIDLSDGSKTITSTPTGNTFIYTETGTNASATIPQFIYPCFRDGTGLVRLKTTAAHNLTSNQHVLLDNLYTDLKSVPIHAISGGTGLGAGVYAQYTAAVLLQNGQPVVTGGNDGANQSDVITYLPDTNSWTTLASMNVSRSKHTATLLNNGRILVTGGNEAAPTATCEVYDFTLNTWINVASMTTARFGHTATLLNDGRVLVAGGGTATCEIYNPITNTWTTVASLAVSKTHHSAVKLNDGRVLVAGGYTTFPTALATCEIYNTVNNTWSNTGNMPAGRFFQTLVLTRQVGVDGRVLAFGGTNDGTNAVATMYGFDIPTGTWTAYTSSANPRFSYGVVELANGKILYQGGYINASANATYSWYDPKTDKWHDAIYTGAVTRATHSLFLLNSGKVLVGPSKVNATDTPELFDYQTRSYGNGHLNGTSKVTVINPTVFTYDSKTLSVSPILTSFIDKHGQTINAKGFELAQQNDPTHLGPYIIDPKEGPVPTNISSTLVGELIENHTYTIVEVGDATQFPDEVGYLVFNLGFENQTFPVKYISRISATELLIDSSFVFPKTIKNGASVVLLNNLGPYVPENPEEIGLFYVTDSISGRIYAQKTINDIVAAGASINEKIDYPNDIGLGGHGYPEKGVKISDKVYIWGNEEEYEGAKE